MAASSSTDSALYSGYSLYPLNFIIAYGNHAHEYASPSGLPWEVLYSQFPKLREEQTHFKEVTSSAPVFKKNAIIMGRKTYDTIRRKLPGRLNIVLSTQYKRELDKPDEDDLFFIDSFEKAITFLNARSDVHSVFIIGGMGVWTSIPVEYHQYFHKMYISVINTKHLIKKAYETEYIFHDFINRDFIQQHFKYENRSYRKKTKLVDNSQPTTAGIYLYKVKQFLSKNAMRLENNPRKAATDEHNYLNLIKSIMTEGEYRLDRTKVGTLATFGNTMRFSLKNKKLPVITTKRTFLRGITEELLWFISGSTDATKLSQKGIKIWDANSSKEYWTKRGRPDMKEGDINAGYGFQWRHWGAKYLDKDTDYSGQGIDQLANAIDKIKNNPSDRRIIVSAWNVADLEDMALPPCHMFFQFFVSQEGLSCMMYQRSADVGLGVPFNITSYALLTHMVAHVCKMDANEFIHVLGDTHIYMNHLKPLSEQLLNKPTEFPTVEFSRPIDDIDDFKYEDIKIVGYKPVPSVIKMEMAV